MKKTDVRHLIEELLSSEMDENVIAYNKEKDEFLVLKGIEVWAEDTVLIVERDKVNNENHG